MKLLLLPLAALTGVLAMRVPECPPKFELGQTYHQVQQGPCPDLDSIPAFRGQGADSVHVAYQCRSKQTMVVGSIVTGKVEAFFLYKPE